MSIMQGFDEVVDRALGITHIGTPPHYAHKSSALALASRPWGFDAAKMLRDVFEVLHSNHAKASRLAKMGPSAENWRWEKKLEISRANESPEKTLEKAIVSLTDIRWVNQVPTVSGLWDPTADRHRNVDLAHYVDEGIVELIELKVASDNPLKAAIEIVQYGLLYPLAREFYHGDALAALPLLHATEIRLRVLAPEAYYARMRLGWLSMELDRALQGLSSEISPGRTMNFAFEAFPSWFSWPCSESNCLRALDERKRYW